MPDHVVGIDGVEDAKEYGTVCQRVIFFYLPSRFQVGWGQFAFSFFQIIIGIGMVLLGYAYL